MNGSISTAPTSPAWLPYASTELPPPLSDFDWLESWLEDVLRPLSLSPDVTGKIVSSAQDSAGCIPTKASRVRIVIFSPVTQSPSGQTWGFFRMVKNEADPAEVGGIIHEIAFYLYVESSVRPG